MTSERAWLSRIEVSGLWSLREAKVPLGRVNVLIGPNGSGKSNLLRALSLPSLFRSDVGSVDRFVAREGGASRILHGGPKRTSEARLRLDFLAEPFEGELTDWRFFEGGYEAHLTHAAGDGLALTSERFFVDDTGLGAREVEVKPGVNISYLGKPNLSPEGPTAPIPALIAGMRFYHFHDTSFASPLRQNAHQSDSVGVRPDGANLAAYLYRLRNSTNEDARAAFRIVERAIQQIVPGVARLDPDLVAPELGEASAVRLYFRDRDDRRLDTHALSDGTLRAIALFAALTEPRPSRPTFIAIDEPELGLHPAALGVFAGLLRAASEHTQILVATQSPALLDHFDPEEVIVAEHRDGESQFERLDPDALASWLEDYSLSELYDKNVLGGRP